METHRKIRTARGCFRGRRFGRRLFRRREAYIVRIVQTNTIINTDGFVDRLERGYAVRRVNVDYEHVKVIQKASLKSFTIA